MSIIKKIVKFVIAVVLILLLIRLVISIVTTPGGIDAVVWFILGGILMFLGIMGLKFIRNL